MLGAEDGEEMSSNTAAIIYVGIICGSFIVAPLSLFAFIAWCMTKDDRE